MQGNGQCLEGVTFRLGKIVHLLHAGEHQVAAAQGVVRIQGRVVTRGLVHHAHQHGAFFREQFRGLLSEKLVGRRRDAIGIGAEEHGVHVHVHDFVLGVIPLQLDGGNPLLQFNPHHAQPAHMRSAGIKGFGQLLGDGGSAALGGIPGKQRAEKHTPQGLDVYAGMFIEPFVLRGHGRLHQRLGQFFVADKRPVFDMIGGQDFPFLRYDLRGQLGIRVFQFFDGGYIGKGPYGSQQQRQHRHRGYHDYPEPLADFLLCTVRHAINFFPVRKTLGLVKSSVHKIKQKIWIYPRILLYFAENYRAAGP